MASTNSRSAKMKEMAEAFNALEEGDASPAASGDAAGKAAGEAAGEASSGLQSPAAAAGSGRPGVLETLQEVKNRLGSESGTGDEEED